MGRIKHIAFEATMNPKCSWWNPNLPRRKTAYVLQHEQIHFAISEIAARKITRKTQATAQEFIVIGNSYQQVRDEIIAKVKTIAQEAMAKALQKHTTFDEDISLFNNPKAHKW